MNIAFEDVRITSKNLKKMIMDRGLDKVFKTFVYEYSEYTLPLFLSEKDKEIKPTDYSIFNYFASYIKEEYENWDLKFIEEPKVEEVIIEEPKVEEVII